MSVATPVASKLGVRPGARMWLCGRPDELHELLPFEGGSAPAQADVLVGFVRPVSEVTTMLSTMRPVCRRGRALWFADPKLSGRWASDRSRDRGWAPLAGADMLPVTQIAIDDDWSAPRFRYRDRIGKPARRSEQAA